MVSGCMHSLLVLFLIAHTQYLLASAFQPSLHVSRTLHKTSCATKLNLVPEIVDSIQQLPPAEVAEVLASSGSVESWRQYIPLIVTAGVIGDILLGSPIANLALGPMRRASEKGATGDSADEDPDSNTIYSAYGGKLSGNVDRSKERVDSESIAKAALDKALGSMELRRFLEENKTPEQRYEDVRKKLDKQMDELDEIM